MLSRRFGGLAKQRTHRRSLESAMDRRTLVELLGAPSPDRSSRSADRRPPPRNRVPLGRSNHVDSSWRRRPVHRSVPAGQLWKHGTDWTDLLRPRRPDGCPAAPSRPQAADGTGHTDRCGLSRDATRVRGYYGTYDVDETTRRVAHHIESASNPAWIGTDFIRWYRFEPAV